jgi:hypothetical protein
MNKFIYTLVAVVTVAAFYLFFLSDFIKQDKCLDSGGSFDKVTTTCNYSMEDIPYNKFDGVIYSGVIKSKSVTFEVIGTGDAYRLSSDGNYILGQLNTEKGFQDESNATVFILDWQDSESEKIKFVKLLSNPSKLILLDSSGNLDKTQFLIAHQDSIN